MNPFLVAIISAAVPAVIALTGWVVRALVIDRILRLEESATKQGARIGELESWTSAHEAVSKDRDRRRRRDPRAPADEDSGG